jgi:hypothetical protein
MQIGLKAGRLASLFVLLSAAFLVRCSDSSGDGDGGGLSGSGGSGASGASGGGGDSKDPCQTIYEGLCGGECESDDDCESGLYCGADDTCTAQCGPGASLCGPTQTCSSNGRCVSNGTGGTIGVEDPGIGGADPGIGGSGSDCAAVELTLEDVIPTVVLLIDQSGSMEESDLEPGLDRWTALKQALTGDESPIKALEDKVRFGMTFYHNHAQLDEPPEEGVCPIVDKGGEDETLMPPAFGRFEAFSEYFLPLGTFRNTPTAESFERVAADLEAFDEPGPKYIVLATDGNPDRCENNRENAPGANGGALSRQMVVDAVTAAYEKDITTFVISVGGDVTPDHLRNVANVGQGYDPDDPEDRFYLVTSAASLTAAFQDIISGTRSCELTLDGEIDPDQADKGEVKIDGKAIPMDEDNGWVVIDGQTIELKGKACDTIKNGEHVLSARFPCEAVVVPPVPK